MFRLEDEETYKIKSFLYKSGLFYGGLDNIVAKTLSDKMDKRKYKIIADDHLYVLDVAKIDNAKDNLKNGTIIQKYLSNYGLAPMPFYVDPNGAFVVSEYLKISDSIDNVDIKEQDMDSVMNQFSEIEDKLKSNVSSKNITLRTKLLSGSFPRKLKIFEDDGYITPDENNAVINYILNNEEFNVPLVMQHSDIQPSNILYDKESGKIKLIDFELAGYGGEMYDWACLYNTMPKEYKSKFDDSILDNPQFILYDFDFNIRKLHTAVARYNKIEELIDMGDLDESYPSELEELRELISTTTFKYKIALNRIKQTPGVVKKV